MGAVIKYRNRCVIFIIHIQREYVHKGMWAGRRMRCRVRNFWRRRRKRGNQWEKEAMLPGRVRKGGVLTICGGGGRCNHGNSRDEEKECHRLSSAWCRPYWWLCPSCPFLLNPSIVFVLSFLYLYQSCNTISPQRNVARTLLGYRYTFRHRFFRYWWCRPEIAASVQRFLCYCFCPIFV